MSGNHESADVENPVLPEALLHTERLAYSVEESAQLLGIHYFNVYRMIQRGKLRSCRVLRGKLLVPRSELLKLLKVE
jgi:excisionase family DNA binding protein